MGHSNGHGAEVEGSEEWYPRVSVVIPVYNGSNYLAEAIDSALAQTYCNTEVIVVNDGSTDDGKTEEIALSYGEKIRYFRKENGGVASALNMGIREMTGEYFSWLSHDDVYYPDKLRVQIDWLARDRGDVVLFSDYDYIDGESRLIGTKRMKHTETGAIYYSLIMEGSINGCTVLVPNSCFADVGLFKEDLRTTQDFDLWFRLARKYEFRHINQVLIKSRIHPLQCSITLPQHMEEQNDLYINALRDLVGGAALFDLKGTLSSFYVKAGIRLTSMGCTKAADFAMRQFRMILFKERPGQIMRNVARYTVYFVMRRVYKHEVPKKLIKSMNRFIQNRLVPLIRR